MAEQDYTEYEHWTLEKAQALTPLQLAGMSASRRNQLAQFYQNVLRLRVASYKRAGVEPYAYMKLQEDFEKANNNYYTRGQVPGLFEQILVGGAFGKQGFGELSEAYQSIRDPNAAINQYIYRLKTFFASKSATVAGWRDITKQQDIQLFGAEYRFRNKYVMEKSADGKRHRVYLAGPYVEVTPNDTLTESDRKKLWSIIDLAKDAGFMNVFGYSSEQVHREIASMFKRGEFSTDDIDAAHAKILRLIAEKQGLEGKYEEHAPGNSGDVFLRPGVKGGDDNVWR